MSKENNSSLHLSAIPGSLLRMYVHHFISYLQRSYETGTIKQSQMISRTRASCEQVMSAWKVRKLEE